VVGNVEGKEWFSMGVHHQGVEVRDKVSFSAGGPVFSRVGVVDVMSKVPSDNHSCEG